jgi:tetratricopeptide (TPR) repeat protein
MNPLSVIGLAAVGWMIAMPMSAQEPVPTAPEDLPGLLGEVQKLQSNQRYVDALLKLEEIEKKFPDSADIHNIRGSIQLAPSIRDFAAAEASFQRAGGLSPGALAPVFNLAEVRFVKHEWKEAQVRFEALLEAFPQLPLAVRHLVLFKLLVCRLKTEDIQGAEALLASSFTFMDDTPAYYMAKAAMAFQKKDEAAAQDWQEKARAIFGEKSVVSYLDCLMEARWVPHIGLPPVADEVKP